MGTKTIKEKNTRANRVKSKKFVRTPKGKISSRRGREARSRHTCAITKDYLHGTTNKKTNKLSKTKKRPSVPFGGVLSTKARQRIMEETALAYQGFKTMEQVPLNLRNYVEQALKRIK